jgi:hypothetical protein
MVDQRVEVLCLLVSPHRAAYRHPDEPPPTGSGRKHFLPLPSGVGKRERSDLPIEVTGKVPDLSRDWTEAVDPQVPNKSALKAL